MTNVSVKLRPHNKIMSRACANW